MALVNDTAGHPFRQGLPPHVLGTNRAATPNRFLRRIWRSSDNDWLDFLAAYCATFVAVSIFIL